MKRPASTYQYAADVFLRLLGLVYLFAFYSLHQQLPGLIGERGILPAGAFFETASEALGESAYWRLPSLLWWWNGNTALMVLSWLGMAGSACLVLGLLPPIAAAIAWLMYLSLTVGGQVFLSFQWDGLLLECGLLAIVMAPWVWRSKPTKNPPVSRLAIFLLHWLLFRLMFSSGYVKWASGDPSWRDLSALTYHFWTQPLPVWIAWYAHQLPLGMLKAATAVMFAIECAVPFLIFLNRCARGTACVLFVGFQLMLVLTGNYGYFNLLAVVLCIPLLDDRFFLAKVVPTDDASSPVQVRRWLHGARIVALCLLLLASLPAFAAQFRLGISWPSPVRSLLSVVAPFRIANSYGLFASMTKTRQEIVLEGSRDGMNWIPYEFPYKPGDVYRTPIFAALYMPRLDWQMWFAALGPYQGHSWVIHLMGRLLENEPDVLALLEINPFPDEPPQMVRAVLYEYTFSTPEQYRATFAWWNRELKGLYCPIIKRAP